MFASSYSFRGSFAGISNCVIGFVLVDVIHLKKDIWFSKLDSNQIDSVEQFLSDSGYI